MLRIGVPSAIVDVQEHVANCGRRGVGPRGRAGDPEADAEQEAAADDRQNGKG